MHQSCTRDAPLTAACHDLLISMDQGVMHMRLPSFHYAFIVHVAILRVCTVPSHSLHHLLVWWQIMVKHRIAHDQFSQLAVKLVKAAPPCMSSGDDWEPTLAALEELNLSLEHDNPAALTPLPDASGE